MKLGLACGLHNLSRCGRLWDELSGGNHACFVSEMSRGPSVWLGCILLERWLYRWHMGGPDRGWGGEHLGWSPAVLWGRSGQGPAASSLWAQEDVTQQHRWEDSSAGAVEMCPRRESVCLLCVPGRLCSRPLLLWTGSSFLLASVPEVTKRALSRLSSGGSAPGWLSV